MDHEQLKKLLHRQLHDVRPNEWEVDEVLEHLHALTEEEQRALLGCVSIIWPVSHSLCFSFLENGPGYIRAYGVSALADWVRELLGWYEKEGLRRARSYMAQSLSAEAGREGAGMVRLEDMRRRLIPFLHGLSGSSLEIAAGDMAWTDSQAVYLPLEVEISGDRADNHRLFTFLACCQWAYLAVGTFRIRPDDREEAIEEALEEFEQPPLAAAVLHLLEFGRACRFLRRELPGLMRHMGELLPRLVEGAMSREAGGADGFGRLLLEIVGEGDGGPLMSAGDEPWSIALWGQSWLKQVYHQMGKSTVAEWERYRFLVGRLEYARVRERVAERRREERQEAVSMLAQVIANHLGSRQVIPEPEGEGGAASVHQDGRPVVHLVDPGEGRPARELRVDNEGVELPPDLAELLARIGADLGMVPDGYVQAAAGMAGRGRLSGSGGGDDSGGDAVTGGVLYDEWDYRRRGYRKEWCTLIEKSLLPVRSTFVDETLARHRGTLLRLRRQFESLRTQYRFVRRRRHGDDIDCDALVDALADRAAGHSPSERLFVQLLRDTRDIGVLFLVDMSNSTEGWVGKAIKESLVLLTDVLEVVGDSYGIYGFSGMRRSRCDLYRIKGIDEPDSQLVRQRISAITPKEYTRMATPVRHLTSLLMGVSAKIRLLIVISDGKPEDYDDYKGEYAIEDTRQALNEARGKGVIPFCITVDRSPHDYLPHLFGRGNYIFINEIGKLPQRMPEIYRLLTS